MTIAETIRTREIRGVARLKDSWLAHAAANRARIAQKVGELWLDENPRSGVLIAAGPSLAQSIPEVRALDRTKHEIVAVDMALGYLVGQGVIPDYVVCSDSRIEVGPLLDVKLPQPVSLLLNVIAHPDTAQTWSGPIYWYCMMSNFLDGDAGEMMQRQHERASGVSDFLIPGGNVGSIGLSFLASVRACARILLYGHDFCWTSADDFYCGGVQRELAQQRILSEREAQTVYQLRDISGRLVWTNASLLNFARWYADIDRILPGLIENRTPTTILRTGGPIQ